MSNSASTNRRRLTVAIAATSSLACLSIAGYASASAPPGSEPPASEPEGTATASSGDFDLDALIAAAQEEGALTAWNSSGIVEDEAAAFAEAYGIDAEGLKLDEAEQADRVARESEAGNVTVDVIAISDGGILAGRLQPEGYVENWVPPDVAGSIPEEWQNPLTQLWKSNLIYYNTEANPDGCPITNLWQLTDPEWGGRVAVQDPLGEPKYIDWFSYLVGEQATALADAYEAYYGEPLETDEENAGYEFIARLAANSLILTPGDDEAAEAVGAPGQDEPPVGFFSQTKLELNEESGYQLGLCADVVPFTGFAYPKYVQIVTDGPHPNAAQLFVHFLLNEEGANIALDEGGYSANTDIPMAMPLPGIDDWESQFMFMTAENNEAAWELRQQLQDFWRLNVQ
jgi:iron(III) transport system substrate-binding protein